MKRLLLSCLLLMSCLSCAHGETKKPAAAPALSSSDLLARGRWSEAIPALLDKERQGEHDARLMYNLGLCYHHLNDPGRARVYYEAARRRDPWHRGLLTNLAALKGKLLEPEPDETWLQAAMNCAPPGVLACAMVMASWFTCGLAWLYRREPRERFLWTGLAGFLLTCLCAALWVAHALQPTVAAVLPETASLKNGPGNEFTESVPLHAGNLVEVISEQGDWVEVDALGRVRAWVRRDELQWVP